VGHRSAGEFRGIPNLGDAFHPGYVNSNSLLLNSGPLKLTILSETIDDAWEAIWEIYRNYARFTLRRSGGTYWFLYEGTPGGAFDLTSDFVYRSSGTRNRVDGSWSGDLAAPEWVYFGDRTMRRVLYMVHHENDNASDSYRQMESNMTVFGFGRDNGPCCPRYMTAAPQHFTIGFAEDSTFAVATTEINNAYQAVPVGIGTPQVRPVTGVATLAKGTGGLPTEYSLGQNFPNPFNPSTSIGYGVPGAGTVSIKVYDMLGREITTLVDGYHGAGSYTVQLHAGNLSSGIYVYRMQAGTFTATRRLLLLK